MKDRAHVQWFDRPPPRKVRGSAQLSNNVKQRMLALLREGVPVDQLPERLNDELGEDEDRVSRYLGSAQLRQKQLKRFRRDPCEVPAEVSTLKRWIAVVNKEFRRRNVTHPPVSAPIVRAFMNKADQIGGMNVVSESQMLITTQQHQEEQNQQQPQTNDQAQQPDNLGTSSATDSHSTTTMHFTLANLYRYVVLAGSEYEPLCTELMGALLRFFTERLLSRLEAAQSSSSGAECFDELRKFLESKGETIAKLRIRASKRVYWTGTGRPPSGWDPEAYTASGSQRSLDEDTTRSISDEEASVAASSGGHFSGGLVSRAAAVANVLQIPMSLLHRVSNALATVSPCRTTAYGGESSRLELQGTSEIERLRQQRFESTSLLSGDSQALPEAAEQRPPKKRQRLTSRSVQRQENVPLASEAQHLS